MQINGLLTSTSKSLVWKSKKVKILSQALIELICHLLPKENIVQHPRCEMDVKTHWNTMRFLS